MRCRLIEWIEPNIAREILFNPEAHQWLDLIGTISRATCELPSAIGTAADFAALGGRIRAEVIFGPDLPALLGELGEMY